MKKLFFTALLSLSLLPLFSQESSTVNVDDYGGQIGLGFQILDGTAATFRYYLSPKTVLQFEAGGYGVNAPILFDENGEEQDFNVEYGFGLGGSVNFLGQRFHKTKKSGKHKIKAHGVALRANQVFGDFSATRLTAGWVQEVFKQRNPKHSFLFELGLGAQFPQWDAIVPGNSVVYKQPDDVTATLYLRLHWNWFLK